MAEIDTHTVSAAMLRAAVRSSQFLRHRVNATTCSTLSVAARYSTALASHSQQAKTFLLRQLSPVLLRYASVSAHCQVKEVDCISAARQDGLFLDVSWNRNGTSRYPFVYLRDNCQCHLCRHPEHGERLFDFVSSGVDVDIQPSSIKVSG